MKVEIDNYHDNSKELGILKKRKADLKSGDNFLQKKTNLYFFATLQNPEKCLDILFFYEYCNVLTHTSKQAQDTTVPHTSHPQENVELTY